MNDMAQKLYTLLLYLAAPLIGLRLLLRARRQRDYLRHPGERVGWYSKPRRSVGGETLWLHAVSVGEMQAAAPLVAALRQRYPEQPLLITCTTPTGRAAGEALHGKDHWIEIAYLPYDYPGAIRRFLNRFRPCLCVLLETELWPNLMAAAAQRSLPVILANARLSRRSARGYARIARLAQPAFARLAATAALSDADANRLALLGAPHVTVCGNLKFDATPDASLLQQGERWRAELGARPVWLAASTREGEEILLLDAYRRLRRPDVLLVIVPRHPERFDAVASLANERGFPLQRRSRGLPEAAHQLWLGDSMGELAAYYRMADLAFIGGSLLPLGGQNLIEAAACGCPALIGPHTFNFARASLDAITTGAARRVYNVEDLTATVKHLLETPAERARMSEAGPVFAAAHQGATGRIMAVIEQTLGKA